MTGPAWAPTNSRPSGSVGPYSSMWARRICDELRVDGHATDFPVGPVLEGDALADLAGVGPAAAGPGSSFGEPHLSPLFGLGGESDARPSQLGGLLGAERGVVHAGEEGLEVTPTFSVGFDGGEESMGLVGVDHDAGVDFGGGALPGPADVCERVVGEDPDLAGVLHRVVQDHPFAGRCRCGRLGPGLGLGDPGQQVPDEPTPGGRILERIHPNGVGGQPGDRRSELVGRLGVVADPGAVRPAQRGAQILSRRLVGPVHQRFGGVSQGLGDAATRPWRQRRPLHGGVVEGEHVPGEIARSRSPRQRKPSTEEERLTVPRGGEQ